jgi:hypothetical protein
MPSERPLRQRRAVASPSGSVNVSPKILMDSPDDNDFVIRGPSLKRCHFTTVPLETFGSSSSSSRGVCRGALNGQKASGYLSLARRNEVRVEEGRASSAELARHLPRGVCAKSLGSPRGDETDSGHTGL